MRQDIAKALIPASGILCTTSLPLLLIKSYKSNTSNFGDMRKFMQITTVPAILWPLLTYTSLQNNIISDEKN